jgi:hypothetical protein
MSKKVFTMVFVLILFSAFLGLGPVLAQQKGKPIMVGAPIPRASAYGQNGERGMILATEEISCRRCQGRKRGGLSSGNDRHPRQAGSPPVKCSSP